MKIIQIAPTDERVPPIKYGGTELVVSLLTDELARRGHEVYLFASGDSITRAKLVSVSPKSVRLMTPLPGQEEIRKVLYHLSLDKILRLIRKYDVDIIHQHYGLSLKFLKYFIDTPILETCHGSFEADPVKLAYKRYRNDPHIAISDAQALNMPDVNFVKTIYHGIDLSKYKLGFGDGNYFAFLGRFSPQKGPKEAIEAARKASVNLKLAAKIGLTNNQYFYREIEPMIDGVHIQYIGEIGPEKKSEFLAGAKALLAPIQWDEPFGLYFIESLACGTPVIVFDRGSAKEIIKNNRTGFICPRGDMDCIIRSIKKIAKMPKDQYLQMRKDCRLYAENNFSVERMVDDYEKVYEEIILKKKERDEKKYFRNRWSRLYRNTPSEEFSQRRL